MCTVKIAEEREGEYSALFSREETATSPFTQSQFKWRFFLSFFMVLLSSSSCLLAIVSVLWLIFCFEYVLSTSARALCECVCE